MSDFFAVLPPKNIINGKKTENKQGKRQKLPGKSTGLTPKAKKTKADTKVRRLITVTKHFSNFLSKYCFNLEFQCA